MIPAQQKGEKTDIRKKRTVATPEQAGILYHEARHRLLNVNEWQQISTGLSAGFMLTDSRGNRKEAPPERGDYFRIDIPGPGSRAGRGYDWVQVEKVAECADPPSDTEQIEIQVRPAADPVRREETAHFFKRHATSSFLVRRERESVYAEIFGRNEEVNTRNRRLIDKIRNIFVGTSAQAGFSAIQWQHLADGLLAPPPEDGPPDD